MNWCIHLMTLLPPSLCDRLTGHISSNMWRRLQICSGISWLCHCFTHIDVGWSFFIYFQGNSIHIAAANIFSHRIICVVTFIMHFLD